MAKKYLNWRPKLKLSEMCTDGWNWYLKINLMIKITEILLFPFIRIYNLCFTKLLISYLSKYIQPCLQKRITLF